MADEQQVQGAALEQDVLGALDEAGQQAALPVSGAVRGPDVLLGMDATRERDELPALAAVVLLVECWDEPLVPDAPGPSVPVQAELAESLSAGAVVLLAEWVALLGVLGQAPGEEVQSESPPDGPAVAMDEAWLQAEPRGPLVRPDAAAWQRVLRVGWPAVFLVPDSPLEPEVAQLRERAAALHARSWPGAEQALCKRWQAGGARRVPMALLHLSL